MSKVLAIMIAGLFAAGAYAQNPQGTSTEQANVTNTKPQVKAEAKVDSRPAGEVAAPGGDTPKSVEGGAVGNNKAAKAGEKRAQTRDNRRRNKDGTVKRKTTQGSTPK